MTFQWIRFYLSSALRNLQRTPRRTFISLSAISLAVVSILVCYSFILGVKTAFRRSIITTTYGHYKIYKKGYLQNKAKDPMGYQIEDPSAVRSAIEKEVAPLAFFSERQTFFGLLVHGDVSIGAKGVGQNAVEERKFLTANRIVEGKHLADAAGENISLGAGLAKQMGVEVGENITLLLNTSSGSLNAADLNVSGIFETGVKELDDSTFHIDIKIAERLLRVQGASEVLFAFQDADELKYRAKLEGVVARDFPSLEVLHWHDLIGEYFDNTMGWLESQFDVFQAIILIVATLSISNVFMMSILERTGEFSTLRALGTHKREITGQILTESLVQAALGSLLGLVIGFFVILVVLKNGIYMPPPPNMNTKFFVSFAIPWKQIPYTLLLCTGIGVVAGIFPAIKIGRLNIALGLGRNV
jgi:putative ABC transport system permease protein